MLFIEVLAKTGREMGIVMVAVAAKVLGDADVLLSVLPCPSTFDIVRSCTWARFVVYYDDFAALTDRLQAGDSLLNGHGCGRARREWILSRQA